MEVESPTQHSPLYVDVQSHYRVVFNNMRYLPVFKHWEIGVKLEDKKEEQILGETTITWPHTDPPHTIIYDAERNLLHWENSESMAYLPINIPQRPAYDISSRNTTRANPKILIRKALSEAGDSVASKIQRQTPWKELLLNKKFSKKSKQDFAAIEHDFNPLFEERLESDQQQKVLLTIVKNYGNDGIRELMERLLNMRFFDLGSLNFFVANNYSTSDSNKKVESPGKMNGTLTNGLQTSTSDSISDSNDGHDFLHDLLSNKQFLLCDNSFVTLLRHCAHPESKKLRQLLVTKNMPLDNLLRKRVLKELENEVIVSLLELYSFDFLTRTDVSSELVGKVLDLLLFITNGFNDKVVWEDASALLQRIQPILGLLQYNIQFPLRVVQLKSTNKLRSMIGSMPPPNTDFRRRRVILKKTVV